MRCRIIIELTIIYQYLSAEYLFLSSTVIYIQQKIDLFS